MCLPVPAEVRRAHLTPWGTGVIDACQLTYRCWELNLGSLKERQMLVTTEPSLKSLGMAFNVAGLLSLVKSVVLPVF